MVDFLPSEPSSQFLINTLLTFDSSIPFDLCGSLGGPLALSLDWIDLANTVSELGNAK